MTPATTTAAGQVPAPAPPSSFALVPFHDTEILAARVGEQVRVPMKRFCGTIGLPWDGQRRRIERDEVLREGAVMMTVPTDGGEQRQTTLPLDLIPGFLFGADASRFAPELRERVRTFRRECFAVLHAHFFRAAAAPALAPVVARAPVLPGWQELDAARRAAPALLALLATETRPQVRAYLHALLVADCDRLSLPAPALADLVPDDTPDDLIAQLMAGLETLTARRVRWNHLGPRANGRMAIMLPEIERLFRTHDIDVAIDEPLRRAMRSSRRWHIARRAVDSAIARKPVLAVVIAPWPNGELG